MITIFEALNWLNGENPSELTGLSSFWIDRLRDPAVHEDEKRSTILDLNNSIGSYSNVLEQAEILVNCAAYGYELRMDKEAATWLDKAADLFEYTKDLHRLAVANWMLFIVHRALGRYQYAFDRARRARKIFIDQAKIKLVQQRITEENWYQRRILEMTCDLISSPEDTYEWLFEFQGSRLSASASLVKSRIAEQIERGDFVRTGQEMQLLLGLSKNSLDSKETGEVLAYCGVIAWVLENKTEAIGFFRSGMTQFIPGSREHTLIRWMLGLALFSYGTEQYRAINHMETCIIQFDDLRRKAIQNNWMDQRDWYAIHHIAMKRVLRTKTDDSAA